MTRSKRLEPVTRVAEHRERQAAVKMAEFRRFLDEQQQRLVELVNYRAEYTQRFETAGRQGLDAQRAADFRRILVRLNEAVAFQEQRIAAMQRDFANVRQQWADTHTRAAALDKVVERYRAEERLAGERREQGESDDRAQRPVTEKT